MEVPMTTARGTADAESLGVEPLPVRDVLERRALVGSLRKAKGPAQPGPSEHIPG